MRIRSTKPEFWRSERIASVSWDARLVLKGLESFVDDNGVGKDDIALIVADVFPRDLSRNATGVLQKVSEAISQLAEAGLLWRYEIDGTNLVYVAFWESIQRIEKPTRGRFRRPDGTINYRESVIGASIPEPSRNPPVALRPGAVEQGNRGTGEELPSSPAAPAKDRFDEFWLAYPRKVGKGAAVRAWKTAAKKADEQTLIDAAVAFGATVKGKDPKFTPHPATWLNGERWADDDRVPQAEPQRDHHGRVMIGGGW